jgi:hypothetical protein
MKPIRLNILRLNPESPAVKELRKNWVYTTSEKITLICIIISAVMIAWRYRMLPPQIPLWYSRLWGSDRLTSPNSLIILVGSLIFIHLLNTVLSITVLKPYRVFIQTLFITSMFVSILTLITITEILFLVT